MLHLMVFSNSIFNYGYILRESVAHGTLRERVQHFLVWTAPGIGMFCGSFVTSWFLRTFGSRRFFAIMMMISAAATALLAMTPQIKYGNYAYKCCVFLMKYMFWFHIFKKYWCLGNVR